MEEAAAVRRAAVAAVDDVEPRRLRDRIEARLDEASVAPGVLTLASASAVADGTVEQSSTSSVSESRDDVADRAAAVQLIYEGLGLTRSLAQSDPWSDGATIREDGAGTDSGEPSVPRASGNGDDPVATADADEADLDVLIADILVSRGFYLLARTEAAEAAVGVVRAFGTDQTVRRETGDGSLDRNLESDVLELAVVAGTTAAGGRAPDRLREYATDLVADGLPSADRLAGDDVRDALAALSGSEPPASDGVRTSADH